MTKPIIEVHDLSKQYRLGVIGATTLRDSFERFWLRLRNGRKVHSLQCQLTVKPQPTTDNQQPETLIQHPKSDLLSNQKSEI